MPKKPSEQFIEGFANFLQQVDDTASRKEVFHAIKDLLEAFREYRATLDQTVAQNKDEVVNHKQEVAQHKADLSQQIEDFIPLMQGVLEEAEARLAEKVDQLTFENKSDNRTTMRLIEQRSDDLRMEMPAPYDDSTLRAQIEQVRRLIPKIPEIPERFDPSDILDRLDTIDEEMKRLRDEANKSRNTVFGAVTNLRIRQAFKYILQTEEPTGAIDGNNTSYTVTKPIFAVLSFSINGEVITKLPNYTVTGRTITFSTALPAVYSGKDFEITYIG